jgi:hypothetical protein
MWQHSGQPVQISPIFLGTSALKNCGRPIVYRAVLGRLIAKAIKSQSALPRLGQQRPQLVEWGSFKFY